MLIPVDYDQPHMYIVIPRATIMNTTRIHSNVLRINQDRILKNFLSNAQEGKEKETGTIPEETNRKQIIKWQS